MCVTLGRAVARPGPGRRAPAPPAGAHQEGADAGEDLRDAAGPLLFVVLMGLLLVNLLSTGRKAYAKRVSQ